MESAKNKSKKEKVNKEKQGEGSEMMEENPMDKPKQQPDLEPDQGYQEVGTCNYRCSIIGKDWKVVWRNFDHTATNLGIKRDYLYPGL